MEVRNCRSCGRLYNHLSGPSLCPECVKKLEDKFIEVREYIRNNPRCTINEVAEANDVSPQQIKQWIREERLEFAKDSPVGIECELCGTNISTGRYCKNCKEKIASGFDEAVMKRLDSKPSKPSRDDARNRMRFLQ